MTSATARASPGDLAVHHPSNSPPRPSYSPFTPTLSHSALEPDESFNLPPSEDRPAWESDWIEQPEPTPINLDDNTDAIALRAAISILQMQRQQSMRDIKTLDRMKRLAKDRPEAFLEVLQSGRLAKTQQQGIELDDDDDDDGDDGYGQNENKLSTKDAESGASFGQLPTPQNIVRCPPIEWEKYHVVGEPLERLHEQQRDRPGMIEYDLNGPDALRPAHVIAAPYRPFNDRLEESNLGVAKFRGSDALGD